MCTDSASDRIAHDTHIVFVNAVIGALSILIIKAIAQGLDIADLVAVRLIDYVLICVSLPIIMIGSDTLLAKRQACAPLARHRFELIRTAAYALLLAYCLSVIDFSIYIDLNPGKPETYGSLATYVLCALVGFGVAAYSGLPRGPMAQFWILRGYVVAVIVLSAYMANFLVINEWHNYNTNALNFGVVLYPIVQVLLGKAVLIDFQAQYGLYAHLLEPVLRLTGGSIVSITSVFSVLLFLSLLMIGLSLARITDNKFLALAGLVSMVYVLFFSASLWPYELYFQVYPLRMIFPAYAVWAASSYVMQPSTRAYIVHVAVLSLGILWNVDVGVVAFSSFVAAAAFRLLLNRNESSGGSASLIVRAIGMAALVCCLVLGAFFLYMRIRYAAWPDLSSMFVSHRYFLKQYSDLALNKAWVIVALIYSVGLAYSVRCLARRQGKAGDVMVFCLTILGIGLFSYHANQPYDQVLPSVAYPAMLLLVIFSDMGLKSIGLERWGWLLIARVRGGDNSPGLAELLLLACAVSFLSFACAAFFVNLNVSPVINGAVRIQEFHPASTDNEKLLWERGRAGETSVEHVRVADIASGNAKGLLPPWKERATKLEDFFRLRDEPAGKMAIFSMWDAYLHLKLRTPSALGIINSQHLIVTKEWDGVVEAINRGEIDWVIFDTAPMLLNSDSNGWLKIRAALEGNYHKVAEIDVQPSWYDGWRKTQLLVFGKT